MGAATGGIWKTTNGGASWETSSIGLPNLGTNALVQAVSNPDIMYAGTGEQSTGDQNGSGLFKSTDHGQNWSQIIDPKNISALQMIGRIIVNPANENEVVVIGSSSQWSLSTPTSGIYKSTDGGTSWEASLLFNNGFIGDMVISTPNDWDTQYASIKGAGVYKSTDGGDIWRLKSSGISSLAGSNSPSHLLIPTLSGLQKHLDNYIFQKMGQRPGPSWAKITEQTTSIF